MQTISSLFIKDKQKRWGLSLCFTLFRFNHGSCAECCRLSRPHPVRVPGVVAWGWRPAADPEPAGADEPRGRRPVPGPGGHQLLLHLRPHADEAPTVLTGTKPHAAMNLSFNLNFDLLKERAAVDYQAHMFPDTRIYGKVFILYVTVVFVTVFTPCCVISAWHHINCLKAPHPVNGLLQ